MACLVATSHSRIVPSFPLPPEASRAPSGENAKPVTLGEEGKVIVTSGVVRVAMVCLVAISHSRIVSSSCFTAAPGAAEASRVPSGEKHQASYCQCMPK